MEGGPSPYLIIFLYSISASLWVNVYTYREKEKESDDSYYLYHPTTGVDLPPLFSPPYYVKLWIMFGMRMSPAFRGVLLYAKVHVRDFIVSA